MIIKYKIKFFSNTYITMLDKLRHILGIYNSQELAIMNLLANVDIFSEYSNKQLFHISQKFSLYNYKIGDIVIKQGDDPGIIGIVQEGILQVIKNIDGKKVILGEIRSGGIYAEMSYFNNTTAIANLIANSNVIVWEISIQDFQVFLDMYPDLIPKIKKIIDKREESNKNIL